jgi:transcription initiation factor IIF auxiliary subunit
MALKLRNSWKYIGDNDGDWWEWKAFLDDFGSGELANVESVEYVLHPTFPEPVREVDDPDDGFALETGGWGEFKLKAFVHLKDGEKIKLTHDLVLKDKPKTGVSA